jgi:hypothetical protein
MRATHGEPVVAALPASRPHLKEPAMLYDVTIPFRPTLVKPKDAASYDLLCKARKNIGEIRFQKDCRIIDAALEKLVVEGQAKNKLIFTKAGFLVGHQSQAPHVEVQHVWDSAEFAFPSQMTLNRTDELAAECQLKFVGGLVRWRISMLDDTWLVYRRESGKFNKFTGKEITVSEYWIDNNFVFTPPPKKRGFGMDELKGKFGQSHSL